MVLLTLGVWCRAVTGTQTFWYVCATAKTSVNAIAHAHTYKALTSASGSGKNMACIFFVLRDGDIEVAITIANIDFSALHDCLSKRVVFVFVIRVRGFLCRSAMNVLV